MGYTTNFQGKLKLNKQLTLDHYNFLNKLAETRRMARNVGDEYGIEGEFYVDGGGLSGQATEENVIDHNKPPRTQPGLWLQWVPTEDGKFIEWSGGEKFYSYVEWLKYLNDVVFPWLDSEDPYKFDSGSITWEGEEFSDRGSITASDGKLTVVELGAPEGAIECPNCNYSFVVGGQ